MDILEALKGVSLKQLVKSQDHILDLALTNGDRLSDVELGENLNSSDHQCLLFDTRIKNENRIQK